jgi:hypothetical protein
MRPDDHGDRFGSCGRTRRHHDPRSALCP